ncbi:hypothetical protein BCR32DRAFT_266351 [Anaeromyces robustus]|uniref:Uncharacterized protein n=1 Tax=Anaeromyces robustus TaxID=1754192 RepID=A0A1Y1XF61_9FUNG|nr:hypothetical protein BCR32DRAFT_266351 [Anaeromyces robustus]|eukprot:ORX84388.1 hypothetical protein BCR32DRAFT_266351 [Anaeromyces robustus]
MNVNNALFSAEQVIDRSIIRSGEGHGGEEKQERFRKTAMAMQEIISKKLYKAKHSTMEQYFKEVFKLSRASVYRFVDASRVLNQLEGFHILPFGERQCRTLRRCTKDLQTIRLLWSTVLNKYGEDPSLITSTIIQNTWDEMIEKKLVDPSKISNIKSNNNSNDKNGNKNKKDTKATQKKISNNNSSKKPIQGSNDITKLMIPSSGSTSNVNDLSNMNINQKYLPTYSSTATLVDSSNNNTLSDIAGLQIDDTGASIYTITNCNNQSYSVTSQTAQSPMNKNKNTSYSNFTSSLQSNSTLVATPTSNTISISHTINNPSPSNININSSSVTSANTIGNNNPENYINSNVINSNSSLNALGYTIPKHQNYITTTGYTNTSYPASSLVTSSRLTSNFQRRIQNPSSTSITTSTQSSTNPYYHAYQYQNPNDIPTSNPESYMNVNTDQLMNPNYVPQMNDFINFNNCNQGSYYTQNAQQNSQYDNHYSNYSSAPTSSSYFTPTSDVQYQWYSNDRTTQDIAASSQKYLSPAYYSQLKILNVNSDDIKPYQNQRVIANNYSIPYSIDPLNNIDNQNNASRNISSRNVNFSNENNRMNGNNSYSINNYPYTVIGIVNSQNNIIQ